MQNWYGFYYQTYELVKVLENKQKITQTGDFVILAVPTGIEPVLPE